MLWWQGPSFLEEKNIPCFSEYSSNRKQDIFNEMKTCTWLIDNVSQENTADLTFEHIVDISKSSCLLKLKRIITWIVRFVNNQNSRLFNKNTIMMLFLNYLN